MYIEKQTSSRYGPTGEGPAQGHENYERTGTFLPWGKAQKL